LILIGNDWNDILIAGNQSKGDKNLNRLYENFEEEKRC